MIKNDAMYVMLSFSALRENAIIVAGVKSKTSFQSCYHYRESVLDMSAANKFAGKNRKKSQICCVDFLSTK